MKFLAAAAFASRAAALLPLPLAFGKTISVRDKACFPLEVINCEGHCIEQSATHADVKFNGFGPWPPIERFFVVPV